MLSRWAVEPLRFQPVRPFGSNSDEASFQVDLFWVTVTSEVVSAK